MKDTYGYEPDLSALDPGEMNEAAAGAAAFMEGMARALREGMRHDDAAVKEGLKRHLAFLAHSGHAVTAAEFAAQCRFFLGDDFHLRMLEGQQVGLAYYMAAAAEAFAAS
ncbi:MULTISPECIES: TipAS antibiotic-recognition domain-containing protein [Paenibacillus]|uniref:TipAS antibiotic-recognition domain-containing protein n=1 Tax=Paenibacillus TaxID=44249 RepID=UPI001F43208C|nr:MULTISPECIES: TipAS antibiotic-recognition domain-containing protein [Paenibacillus]